MKGFKIDNNMQTIVYGPKDGGSMFLRNAGIYPQVHTALQKNGTDIFIAGRTSNLISMVITLSKCTV
jgi:hypothetical protein